MSNKLKVSKCCGKCDKKQLSYSLHEHTCKTNFNCPCHTPKKERKIKAYAVIRIQYEKNPKPCIHRKSGVLDIYYRKNEAMKNAKECSTDEVIPVEITYQLN